MRGDADLLVLFVCQSARLWVAVDNAVADPRPSRTPAGDRDGTSPGGFPHAGPRLNGNPWRLGAWLSTKVWTTRVFHRWRKGKAFWDVANPMSANGIRGRPDIHTSSEAWGRIQQHLHIPIGCGKSPGVKETALGEGQAVLVHPLGYVWGNLRLLGLGAWGFGPLHPAIPNP